MVNLFLVIVLIVLNLLLVVSLICKHLLYPGLIVGPLVSKGLCIDLFKVCDGVLVLLLE